MPYLKIYTDERTFKEIDKVSKEEGVSRSGWVSRLIKKELCDQIPESFFKVLGTWEDDRSPEKIIEDIRCKSIA